MKTIKVGRMPTTDHHRHTHWEVVGEDHGDPHPLEVSDDTVAEIGMQWDGSSKNPVFTVREIDA